MHLKLRHLEKSFSSSLLTQIDHPLLHRHNIKLWIKRDDLLHPVISGNKWRKLKYNLDDALNRNADTLVSMGGAYSNHLHALAYVGNALNLKTIGFIRGERPMPLTPTLLDMAAWGMELRFVSRSDYRIYRTYKNTKDFPELNKNHYWIPEGGASPSALKGVAELYAEIDMPYDYLCVACGTGATLAGLINASGKNRQILGFSVLKNVGYLSDDINGLLSNNFSNWQLNMDYHFSGFAKINLELEQFMHSFEQTTLVPLEPVYTGKMLYGLFDLMGKGFFKSGQRIVAVHTGGLQGNRGYRTWKGS